MNPRMWLAAVAAILAGTAAVAAPETPVETRQAYPPTFHWEDRRPIGTVFLATSGKSWEKNPRGYFNDPEMDVSTDAGKKALRDRMLKLADQTVAHVKDVGGQGIIVWDIEGGEMPHAVTYLGDPRILPKVAPEMDAVADAFFKRFTDAGLRTGVCIRPSSIVFKDPSDPSKYPWIKGRYGHLDGDDPVGVACDKIAYAKKRWGCTIFYMDTNFTPLRVDGQMVRKKTGGVEFRMLNAEEIRAIHQKHPDILLFPEFQQPGYFASSSGYGEYHSVGNFSAEARASYPEAFRVWMPRLSADDVYAHWDEFIQKGIKAREVFLFECSPMRDAFGTLLRNAQAEASTDWQAPKELDKLLAVLQTEKSWPIRRRAALALGSVQDTQATKALAQIVTSDHSGLELFAGRALGKQGTPEAMAVLTEALRAAKGRPAVAAAFGLGATGKAEAVAPLLKAQADAKEPSVRWAAIEALGDLGRAEAVPGLIELLRELQNTQAGASRKKTVEALGKLGDRRAIVPLVEAMEHPDYSQLRPQIARALTTITGGKDVPNPQDPKSWRKWLAQNSHDKPAKP